MTIRLPGDLLKWIDNLAKLQRRTRANMIYQLLAEWFKDDGSVKS